MSILEKVIGAEKTEKSNTNIILKLQWINVSKYMV